LRVALAGQETTWETGKLNLILPRRVRVDKTNDPRIAPRERTFLFDKSEEEKEFRRCEWSQKHERDSTCEGEDNGAKESRKLKTM